ncbi:MAG: insulinase family protein, partial [Lachnospiraceae bacterium]|nr:insulinase family protein [Lachnospiraceae bacterium]
LKKALLDAGIGKDIMGSFDNGIYQPIFSIIAKNANENQKEEFVGIVKNVFEDTVKKGLNEKTLLAGLNSIEFRLREADFGSYPKGLMYGLQCLESWIYDEEQPFLHVEALDTIEFLKKQVKTGYFEKLIQTYFLDNMHVSVVITRPEKGLNAKIEKELEEKLKTYRETLSKEELQQLIEDTRHLEEYQQEPSSKEDLEKIPLLKREDLEKDIQKLVNEEKEVAKIPVLYHDIFTNGIQYVDFLFDISHIREEELPYVGILKAVLGYVDTQQYGYADLSDEINLHTGGINSSILITANVQDLDDCSLKFEIRTKFLKEKVTTTMNLVKEILCHSKLEDDKRLYEILAESKSRLQMAIGGMGHSVSAMRAMSYFSKTAKINDLTNGIAFYKIVAELEGQFEEKKEMLKDTLKRLMEKIFVRERLMLNVTSKDGVNFMERELTDFSKSLYLEKDKGEKQAFICEKKNEGFLDASKVQYVARAGNFVQKGYSYKGTLRILKVMMGYDYLWLNIRVRGGAYGCMSGFGRNGDSYFVSYRDPNLRATNEVYEKIPKYLEGFWADEREMTKYIIGTISEMDTPLTPCAKGRRSLISYLGHVSEDALKKEREEVLLAKAEDIRALAPMMEAILSGQNFCVIGNEEALRAEKDLFMELKDLY